MNRKQRRAAVKGGKTALPAERNPNINRGFPRADAFVDAAFRQLHLGDLTKAGELCRAAWVVAPNHAGAIHVLGLIAQRYGRHDEAIELLRRSIALDANSALAHNNLGVVLCQIGKFRDGIASYQQALTLNPDYAVAHSNLGAAYTNDGKPDEAVAQCQRALQLKPDYAEAHHNLASGYYSVGESDKAVAHFERALAINPNYAEARIALCMAELPIVFTDEAEIGARRTAYERRLSGCIDDTWRNRLDLVDAIGSAQPFQLAYQGHNDRDLQSVYGSFICRIMAERYPSTEVAARPAPGELVRVGFVSGYFRQHSNWKIPLKGWISQLDRRRYKVFGYHTGIIQDGQTELAARMCDRFVQGPLSIDGWRKTILADAPHVLIYPEVGMNSVAAKLAAQRLAPVQCNSWGHPETSGFPTLDYYLSSELMEPEDGAAHYTEELVRLPNLSIYYEPTVDIFNPTSRQALGLRTSGSVFWCGQSLFKYLPQFDHIFPQIAQKVADCQFVFIHFPPGDHIKTLFSRRLDLAFRAYGMNFEEYCVFQPQLDPGSFAALLEQCDIVLDSLGWSGCNSTLESLQFDLPIVTMPGRLMRGRHTTSILAMMDVRATIASNLDEYVYIAVRLANEPAWRASIKNDIARNKHRLYRDRNCISALENFLSRVAVAPDCAKALNRSAEHQRN
jgi:protein O-GlcNAc transferase